MIAAGIDLGGTKSELRLFDADWQTMEVRRDATPTDYDALVDVVADQVRHAVSAAGPIPVGIGAAGLIDAAGRALTANLPASGHTFPADIAARAGHPVTYVNDCRALALSEAVFGAGREHRVVLAVVLGTGVGGGLAIDGALISGPSVTGGEFGHAAAAASLVKEYDLPIHRCGCGRLGCYETFVAAPGLSRLADAMIARPMTPSDIAREKSLSDSVREVWNVWCRMTAEMLLAMVYAVDPDVIVLGGGLSRIDGVTADLSDALASAQFEGFSVPPIVVAEGGDTSGSRGAALSALRAAT